MLTPDQVSAYRRDGYIVVPKVLSEAEIAALKAEIDRVLESARGLTANDAVFDLEDSHTAEAPRVRRIKLPHKVSPKFDALIRSDKLTGLVKPLLGPNLRLQTSKLNLKSAGYGAPVEWHQDWAYYPHTNQDVLALGVMLDDFVEDNGPMMVVPGSHRGPILDHHAEGRFCGGIDPSRDEIDFSQAVKLLAPAGSISLHHARLIHGSDINRSGRSRLFMLFEVTAADAWPLCGTASPFTDIEEYNARIIAGEPTIVPRMEPVPIRIPLPKALDQSSLYNAQKGLGHRYFETFEEKGAHAKEAVPA